MYQDSKKLDLVKMCDDCRVNAQYHDENSPFKYGKKPKLRTTDDYQYTFYQKFIGFPKSLGFIFET